MCTQGPCGPGRMYTPRKNMWWEVLPARDTHLQCHRYDATVAWGHLEEAPARILPVPQARRRPSPTGTMASEGSKPGKNGKLCLNPGVFPGWGPGCTQPFPGACGEACGCVTVCTQAIACTEWGATPSAAPEAPSRSGLREGVPGSEVTSFTTEANRTWNPCPGPPHSSAAPPQAHFQETSATERCSLPVFPVSSHARNPRDAAASNAGDVGATVKPNASGSFSGGAVG